MVQIGRFRGEIEVQEAAFFVQAFDRSTGMLTLSDGSSEPLDVATLRQSPIDGAFLCSVKTALLTEGLDARFCHAAQADLLDAVEDVDGCVMIRLGERSVALSHAMCATD